MWLNTVFAGFDQNVTATVHRLYELAGDFFSPFMEAVSFLGKDGIFLIILSLLLMLFKKTRRFGTAMAIGLAIGAVFTNLFLKIIIARPRPYADGKRLLLSALAAFGPAHGERQEFPLRTYDRRFRLNGTALCAG